jgi:hypothetical protein
MTEDSATQVQGDFSEKLRLALEKSWGYPIPTPKFIKDNTP